MEFDEYRVLLCHRIQELRRMRGLTQEQVAELLGMDSVSVGYIEQGRRTPKIKTLYELARIFNVSMEDFFKDA